MGSKFKNPIAILLIIAMAIGLFTGISSFMPSMAYGLVYTEGDIWIDTDGQQMSTEHANQWEYTLSGSDVTLTKYKGDVVDGKIIGKVPASINGNLVTSLRSTFDNWTGGKFNNLTDAPVLPSTVTEMYRTFRKCKSLVSAPEIPHGVTNMGSAFEGCTSLTGDVNIPDKINDLYNMFNGTSLPITMKYSQFNIVANNATVPNNITKKAYLIDDVSGDSTWIDADGKVMTLNETKLWTLHHILYNYNLVYKGPIIDGRIVGQIPAIIDGKQVTHLGRAGDTYNSSFYGNTELVHAPKIPDGVTVTGKMFENNTSLTGDVYIPDSVENATDMFKGTVKPITVYFNNSVAVGYSWANHIAQQVYPDNVTKVSTDTDVWIGTDGKVMSPEHKAQWAYRYNNDSNIILSKYTGKYTEDGRIVGSVPATINGIPIKYLDGVFQQDKSIKIAPEFPDTVTSMSYTFSGATNLQRFPNTTNNLSNMSGAFQVCTSLTGDIFIPDSVNKYPYLDDTFKNTSKPITMYYNASNTYAAGISVPANVTKVAINSMEDLESSKPIDGVTPEGDIVVEITSSNGTYSIEVGNELQLQATVSRNDLEYKWVIQDIYDTNGQDNYYATIDENGRVTGIGAGYVVAGLMVKFEDGTEETYGLTLIEVTKDGRYGYGSQYLYDLYGGYGGSYGGGLGGSYGVGGWNYGYSSSGSLGSYFTAGSAGGGFSYDPDLNGGGSGGGDGEQTSEGIEVFVDSNKVNFPDKQPTLSNDKILVPVRFVMEELGFNVYWDTVENKAVLRKTESDGNKLEIIMEPNKNTMLVNGDSYSLEAKVQISSGRLMLPGGELVKVMQDIYYKQETPSSNIYQGFYYSEDVEGTESKLSNIPEIDEFTDNPNLEKITNANEEEILSKVPNHGTGDEGMASEDSNLQIIGLVEPITTLDVIIPLNINFTIDAERNFIKPDNLKIISNCPAPLRVYIAEVDKKTEAPNIVQENAFTDSGWNNLNRKQTSENIALSLNNINLSTNNVELGTLRSGFREAQELNIDLTSKYGKAWSNKEEINFSYGIVFLIEMQ